MIQGKWFAPGEPLAKDLLSVQEKVFGVSGKAHDPEGWNTLVFMDEEPAASGRIWWQDGSFWLGNIGVVPSLRGRRLGDLVLRLLLFKAQSHAAREVRLVCPPDLTGFFARLGLREDGSAGEGLVEMMIPGDRIDLDTCASCPKSSCPNRKG